MSRILLVEDHERLAHLVSKGLSSAGIAVDVISRIDADASTANWQRHWDVNVMAHVFVARAVLPGMLARGRGQFVNISTFSVQMANPYFSAYVASKSALEGFSRCLAVEMVGKGISVSLINYPLVKTAMTAPTKIIHQLFNHPLTDNGIAGFLKDWEATGQKI